MSLTGHEPTKKGRRPCDFIDCRFCRLRGHKMPSRSRGAPGKLVVRSPRHAVCPAPSMSQQLIVPDWHHKSPTPLSHTQNTNSMLLVYYHDESIVQTMGVSETEVPALAHIYLTWSVTLCQLPGASLKMPATAVGARMYSMPCLSVRLFHSLTPTRQPEAGEAEATQTVWAIPLQRFSIPV